MATDPARIPVIIGVGQINDRPDDPMQGLDSTGLMAEAIRRADADAGGGWLERCDWLANVQQMAFPGADVLGQLPQKLGISPATRIEKPPYGDAPIQLISDAANAVAAGEASVSSSSWFSASFVKASALASITVQRPAVFRKYTRPSAAIGDAL